MPKKFNQFRLKRWHAITVLAFLISMIIFIISILILCTLPSIIELNIRQSSALKPGTLLMDKWSKPKYILSTNIWTFSIRNPDAILNASIPTVKKMGPYVFDQIHTRKIHSLINGTMKFETILTYFFNESSSCPECYLHNRVWIPNLIYQKFIEAASKPAMRAATAALLVQKPFLEVDVSELLFDGYTDPFLDQVCAIPIVNFICESVLSLPERIGFFYQKNGTSQGVFEVDTGDKDYGESIGKIITWNGDNTIPNSWWSNKQQTSLLKANEGTLYKPYITKKENITIFVPELCRTLKLVFEKELEVAGISAYRFIVPKEDFDFTLNENKGYCNEKSEKVFFNEHDKECLPNGLLDISRCQQGEAPIIISMPNFLYAPIFVRESIGGLEEPVSEEDQIQLDLEPRLGAVIQAKRRFQINIAMWKGANISLPGADLSKLRSSIVPVLSIDEIVRIDAESLELIKEKLIYTERAMEFAASSATIFSIVAAIIVIVYAIHRKGTKNGGSFFRQSFVSPGFAKESPMSNVSTTTHEELETKATTTKLATSPEQQP